MGKNSIKIKKVYPAENYILICEFENGIKKKYDIKKLIKQYKVFKELQENEKLFKSVKVDVGGYGIYWNEKIDLATEEIWENGEDIYPEELYYNSKIVKNK